jgi:hypothetical protein
MCAAHIGIGYPPAARTTSGAKARASGKLSLSHLSPLLDEIFEMPGAHERLFCAL